MLLGTSIAGGGQSFIKKVTAPSSEQRAGQHSNARPDRQQLLKQHDYGQADDPIQVHDASEEKHGHQAPAAAETKGTMVKPHDEGTTGSVAPVQGQKADRSSTVAQARLLERG